MMAGDLMQNLFASSASPLTPAPPVSMLAPFTQDPAIAAQGLSAMSPPPLLSPGSQTMLNKLTPDMIGAMKSGMSSPPPPPPPGGLPQRGGDWSKLQTPSALLQLLQDPRYRALMGIQQNLGG